VPRVGVLASKASKADSVREAGGESTPLVLPVAHPLGGAALYREWVADWAQISCVGKNFDALLVDATDPAALAGLLIAALRIDLPVVVATPLKHPFAVALAALGFAPLREEPAEIVVAAARSGRTGSCELVESFSLANALRTGLALKAGPELIVHLAAIAREAGVAGFPQMIRVLAPECPEVAVTGSPWFETYGAAGLLGHLGGLHDTSTVAGQLKEALPAATPPAPETAGSRLVFVRGRASGTEVVCRTDEASEEVYGSCRVYDSEGAAVRAVESGTVDPSDLLVVGGCGPRGGPGLLRLDRLGSTLADDGLFVPVLTDGLPPENAAGTWASLATPETAAGGVLGRLRDGDLLRLDLAEGLIRVGAGAGELDHGEPFAAQTPSEFGYAARYARAALPALEGAGFG